MYYEYKRFYWPTQLWATCLNEVYLDLENFSTSSSCCCCSHCTWLLKILYYYYRCSYDPTASFPKLTWTCVLYKTVWGQPALLYFYLTTQRGMLHNYFKACGVVVYYLNNIQYQCTCSLWNVKAVRVSMDNNVLPGSPFQKHTNWNLQWQHFS